MFDLSNKLFFTARYVTALYIEPESIYVNFKCLAINLAMVLFPEDDGPSMAMITVFFKNNFI